MGESFYPDGLQADDRGYFAGPIRANDPQFRADPERDRWAQWEKIYARARQGDFTLVADLIDIYKQTNNWILARACVDLLGAAGTEPCFQRVIAELKGSGDVLLDLLIRVDFCGVLAAWGRLAVVPILLDTYLQVQTFDDAEIIPVHITHLVAGQIPDPEGTDSQDSYRRLVMERYEEVKQTFGTDEVLVFHGGLFSVVALAKRLLSQLRKQRFVGRLRLRFEAATGIDCSKFYEGGTIQTAAATSIVEQFLASPAAEKFEEGVRYFFGHRIGD